MTTRQTPDPTSATAATAASDSIAKPSKADPSIDYSQLGLSYLYGALDRTDADLIAALAPDHTRAFWNLAKRQLFDKSHGQDHARPLAWACQHDERLVRLGLYAARKSARTHGYRTQDMPLAFFMMAMRLEGQSDAWRSARIAENSAVLSSFSACTTYQAVSTAARAGHLAATEQVAELMPDKRLNDEQAEKYRYGRTGFTHYDLGNELGQAWAQALIIAESCSESKKAKQAKQAKQAKPAKRAPPRDADIPTNALFWIAARHKLLRATDPAAAARWGAAGALMIEKGLEVEDGHESISLALGCAPMRKALMARRPVLGAPTFYGFHREEATLRALLLANPSDVAEICAYEESGSSCRTDMKVSQGKSSWIVSPIPAAALALLAGHDPDPSWISLGADRHFHISKSQLDAAKAGTLAPSHFASHSTPARGAPYTIEKLAQALGKALPHVFANATPKASTPSPLAKRSPSKKPTTDSKSSQAFDQDYSKTKPLIKPS